MAGYLIDRVLGNHCREKSRGDRKLKLPNICSSVDSESLTISMNY